MNKLLFILFFGLASIFSCKTSDSSTPEGNTSANVEMLQEANSTAPAGKITKEQQHQFDALVKQGDTNYESGNYREALNFYKEARIIAPDQIGKSKLISCIKAMQEPSSRRKSKN